MRREVEKTWRAYTLPLSAKDATPLWAHIVPSSIGTSGLIVANDGARIEIRLKARTEISTDQSPKVALPQLPPLEHVPDTPGRLAIILPVRLNYGVLAAAVQAEIGDKPFTAHVAGEDMTLMVRDVLAYPSGDRVALGLTFEARVSGRLFDVSGKMFLTAKPVVENDGTLISLANVEFARQLDNPLWNLVSVLLEEKIEKTLAEKAHLDLTAQINNEIAALKASLADPETFQSVRITVQDVKAGIDAIVPEARELTALIRLNVAIDTTLQSLPVDKAGGKS